MREEERKSEGRGVVRNRGGEREGERRRMRGE